MAAYDDDDEKLGKYFKRNNIIVREVSFIEVPEPKDPSLFHVGLFLGHAYNDVIAYGIFSGEKQVRLVSNVVLPEEKILVQLCLAAFQFLKGRKGPIPEVLKQSLTFKLKPKNVYPLKLKLQLQYTPRLAGEDVESPEGLNVYLSSTYSDYPMKYYFPYTALATSVPVELEFNVNRNYIPQNVSINFQAQAITPTTKGRPCSNQAGYASVNLASLIQSRAMVEEKLIVPNSQRRHVKGYVKVRCLSASLPVKQATKMLTPKTQTTVGEYIEANEKFYASHPTSVPALNNLTVYMFEARRGVCPGSMFEVSHINKSDETYYLSALHTVMSRRFPQLFKKTIMEFDILSPEVQLLVALDMVRLMVNYCYYLTDEVYNYDSVTVKRRRKPSDLELIESFDIVRNLNSGDCEDFQKEMLLEVCEIKYCDWATSSMNIVKKLFNDFIFAGVLCGASNVAIDVTEYKSEYCRELCGHECVVAIPKYIFYAMLRKGMPSHPIFDILSDEELAMGSHHKEMYVLEGTGNLLPEKHIELPQEAKIRESFEETLTSRSARKILRRLQFYSFEEGAENFYKIMMTILTPELFFQTGIRQFEFLLCDSATGKRGVEFSKLVSDYNNISLFGAPIIPADLFYASTRIDADSFPILPLTHVKESFQLPFAEKLELFADTSDFEEGVTHRYIFQIRFEDLSEEIIDSIVKSAKINKHRLVVLPETVKIMDNKVLGGYTFILFQKLSASSS